jgi:hypothetical protein
LVSEFDVRKIELYCIAYINLRLNSRVDPQFDFPTCKIARRGYGKLVSLQDQDVFLAIDGSDVVWPSGDRDHSSRVLNGNVTFSMRAR